MSVPTEHYRYNDDVEANAAVADYFGKGLQGFILKKNAHNMSLITEAVDKIGFWNGTVVRHVITELNNLLEWQDTRALADGTQRLSDNPTEYELTKATPEQLKAHLQDKREVQKDEVRYSWQLPLHADRKTVIAAEPKAIRDWALRRRNAGLPDAV